MTHSTIPFREISQDRLEEFLARGYKARHFFPHRFYFLPKAGPDGLKMARRMCGISNPNSLWEIVLYAAGPAIDSFPEELFFDPDLIWHQQHGGRPGQVATADLVIKGRNVYGMNYLSDLVQRISRRREFKTRVENRFKGWHRMLLNAILNFAIEKSLDAVYSATAEFTMQQIPPSRNVGKGLFERIYDDTICKHFRVTKTGSWWRIGVRENRERVVFSEKTTETVPERKTICLCHDIERGLGHVGVDSNLTELADKAASEHLHTMLAVEKDMNIKATYHVLGCFLNEVRGSIETDGHCIAFHSYDHHIDRFWFVRKIRVKLREFLIRSNTIDADHGYLDQLTRLRQLDYRIKGYRPPQSKITSEISDRRLCFHNFEWLASSAYSLGFRSPRMTNRIVKIPILFDDFDMYKHEMRYGDWERSAIETIRSNDFVAFSLHDCYARYWLPHYKEFLEKISELGQFKTLNALTDEVILTKAQ